MKKFLALVFVAAIAIVTYSLTPGEEVSASSVFPPSSKIERYENGFSVKYGADSAEADKIIKKICGRVVLKQSLGEINTLYGYSEMLGEGVEMNGQRVNFQIAVSDGTLTFGYPLIIGSY